MSFKRGVIQDSFSNLTLLLLFSVRIVFTDKATFFFGSCRLLPGPSPSLSFSLASLCRSLLIPFCQFLLIVGHSPGSDSWLSLKNTQVLHCFSTLNLNRLRLLDWAKLLFSVAFSLSCCIFNACFLAVLGLS